MTNNQKYNEDYFLRGKQSGKSLYENYRWMPELTIPMVEAIIKHTGISKGDSILDFGCARGYIVRAFRELGYNATGVDVSEWAIKNCDPEVNGYCHLISESEPFNHIRADWVIAKDVLEHVYYVRHVVTGLMASTVKGIFVVVPLSPFDNTEYIVPEYEQDITHVQRLTLPTWTDMFIRPGWSVEASYRVPGVKDNYARYDIGNGFITAKRI